MLEKGWLVYQSTIMRYDGKAVAVLSPYFAIDGMISIEIVVHGAPGFVDVC
jgi:hypothetical protein